MVAISPRKQRSPLSQRSPDSGAAHRVLTLAADAILALAGRLDETFDAALDVIEAASGRVVVTGMGKSGHVGRKIAATLASTGTPALFVHPAEASHGDLGMITPGDVILALSNSGETVELANLVAYATRFGIALIAITSNADSSLAAAAGITLLLPECAEACPHQLAPTTSTTAMLVLGDAIAVALLDRKGFTVQHFRLLHPGGALGRKLLLVRDLMHSGDELPLVAPDAPMRHALIEMSAKRFGCAGVIDAAGALVGIITDGDLRRHMAPDFLDRRADQVMTREPTTIRPDALAAEALRVMNAKPSPKLVLFAVVDRRPVGILHIHDCLGAGVDEARGRRE